jgi:hypothetical protein
VDNHPAINWMLSFGLVIFSMLTACTLLRPVTVAGIDSLDITRSSGVFAGQKGSWRGSSGMLEILMFNPILFLSRNYCLGSNACSQLDKFWLL